MGNAEKKGSPYFAKVAWEEVVHCELGICKASPLRV